MRLPMIGHLLQSIWMRIQPLIEAEMGDDLLLHHGRVASARYGSVATKPGKPLPGTNHQEQTGTGCGTDPKGGTPRWVARLSENNRVLRLCRPNGNQLGPKTTPILAESAACNVHCHLIPRCEKSRAPLIQGFAIWMLIGQINMQCFMAHGNTPPVSSRPATPADAEAPENDAP